MKMFGVGAVAACVLGLSVSASAIKANVNLSIGKNLYVDGALNSNWKPDVYTDGHLDFNQVASAKELALNVGEGPSRIFITWETRGDEAWVGDEYVHAASCQHFPTEGSSLQNFKILTSGNSADGVDGDWEVVAQVGESGAMSRGIAVDFAGKSWFKIVADEAVKNLEEIGAYDLSDGGNDTWFFMGTSISQMGLKQTEVDSNFSQLIHARYPDYYPAMLRGGIGCVNTTGVVEGLKYYGEYAGNVKFWAIEMGTNDAWGDKTGWNVQTFKTNMQEIIDTAKAHGVTPIIARMIATNPDIAEWQVYQGYLDAIDELTETNNLPKGPDFYDYFSKHPEELSASDGVHPAEKGAQSMHRLWAEAVATLYENGFGDADNENANQEKDDKEGIVSSKVNFKVPQVSVVGRTVSVSGVQESAQVVIMDAMGHMVVNRNLPTGNYFVIIRGKKLSYSAKVTVR